MWGEGSFYNDGTGVVGLGVAGVYGSGFIGVVGDTHKDGGGVYGFSGSSDAPGIVPGTGVTAEEGTGAKAALQVFGRARFSRSGRASVGSGKSSKVVSLQGVTSTSLVFAVLAANRSGRYVRAVVPVQGQFTIYLNSSVSSSTPVSWIVFDPSLA